MNKTWVNEGHMVKKVCQDKNVKNALQVDSKGWSTGLKMPSEKGCRLIITHIGSDRGFVLNVDLIFKSKITGNYYEVMNTEVYERWFGHITENLEPGSVVIMDNAF